MLIAEYDGDFDTSYSFAEVVSLGHLLSQVDTMTVIVKVVVTCGLE